MSPRTAKNKGRNASGRRAAGAGAVAAARAGHRASRWWTGAAVVAVLAFAAVLIVTITQRGKTHQGPATGIPATPITTASGRQTPPPWTAPRDARAAVQQAGLPMLGSEGAVLHTHSHLNVFVDGQPVPVPADIGIDQRAGTISPLHSHDGSGVIHIESPTKATFTLAQLFAEWQVSLSESQIGGLHTATATELRAYVNGKQVPGNPGALPLNEHDQIVLAFGTPPASIPSTYDWGKL